MRLRRNGTNGCARYFLPLSVIAERHLLIISERAFDREQRLWLGHNVCPSLQLSFQYESDVLSSLARRAGEDSTLLQHIRESKERIGSNKSLQAGFNQKDRSYSWPLGEKLTTNQNGPSPGTSKPDPQGSTREVRQLPFDRYTFKKICDTFHVHTSISRVISRADVPFISRAKVNMGINGSDAEKSEPALGTA
jgi:hypothetical protein